MLHDDIMELSKLRLEKAKNLLESSQILIDIGDYKSSANRSYYAVFNAMRACLVYQRIDHKKHSGVISDFRLYYIKTGKLRTELSDIISELFDVRTQSDYNDFYTISKNEVLTQLSNARLFIQEVESLLINIWMENDY